MNSKASRLTSFSFIFSAISSSTFRSFNLALMFVFVPLHLLLAQGLLATTNPTEAEIAQGATKVQPPVAKPLTLTYEMTPAKISFQQNATVKLKLHLLEGYHIYEESFKIKVLQPEGFLNGQPKVAPIVEFFDKSSKKRRRGIEKDATATFVIEAPSSWRTTTTAITPDLKIGVDYQACTQSFCLFPQSIEIVLPGALIINPAAQKNGPVDFFSAESLKNQFSGNLWLAFLIVFIGGILTSFTPCIFPMIPITLAILGNNSQNRTRKENFLTSVFYVLGIAVTYSLLGLFISSTGALFGSLLGNHYVLGAICGILLLMSLSQFGLFEIQTPAFLTQKVTSKHTSKNYAGALASGLIAGIVASPCVGPILVALLGYVATLKNPVLGFSLLFTYAIGMGMIFLVLGSSNQLLKKLPKSGPWMDFVKVLLGALLLGAFYYYLRILISEKIFFLTLALGLILFALRFGAVMGWKTLSLKQRSQKGFMLAVLVLGFIFMTDALRDQKEFTFAGDEMERRSAQPQGLNWTPYSEENLKIAKSSGKPVLIDFWAEWCEACHHLENKTFSDQKVSAELKKFYLLKYDATNDSEEIRKLKELFKIQGLPTIVFFDPTGKFREDVTLTEFESAEYFLLRLNRVK